VPAGLSTFDLVFNDISDRDAGYDKHYGTQNAYWDRLNVNLPNFDRWQERMYAAIQASGRPGILWQIPLENQYFRTLNETERHYSDNKAECLMANIDALADLGVVGLLFGPGANANTVYWDATGDGITNPEPTCTTDGVSTGQICNDHLSTVADDGGYIRMVGGQYYQSPVPLP